MPPCFFSIAATSASACSVERTSSLWNSADAASRYDLGGNGTALLLKHIGDDDMIARLAEGLGGGAADADAAHR